MIELLHYIVENIVSEGVKISIEKEEQEDEVVLNLSIPEEERGRVIGKNGMNIKAIRNILSIRGRREGKRVIIKVLD